MEDKSEEEQAKKQSDGPPSKGGLARWPWVVAGFVVTIFVTVVLLLILLPRRHEKTDDAYVTVHFAYVAPRVAGQVVAVTVDDHDVVHVGQSLVQIDDRNYKVALREAMAALTADRAQVDQTVAQVSRQPSLIAQARAQIAAAQARLYLSEANATRYSNLASTGAGTEQQRQQANAQLRQDRASLRSAAADVAAQTHQLYALRANRETAAAKVQSDEAQVYQAQLNLSYTHVVAPIKGTIDQRSVQVGNWVSPGLAMLIVIPLQEAYVEANYREVALRHMQPGQSVRILVAYDIWLDGRVQSLPGSSGAALSPIPANNATGNFTKIVQRLPVKIVLIPNQPLVSLLRAGMSVETIVDTQFDDVVGMHRKSSDMQQ